jgi:hypothetical protein
MMISEFMRPEMIEARRVELIAAADRYRLAQLARAERQSPPERAVTLPQMLAGVSALLGSLLRSQSETALRPARCATAGCVMTGEPAVCC